ncbi:MAG: MotA/TolQ/ExbB proton channel family protein, partial [SAR324 cluster bacterium]|nr:MotA/TolQ/ExbB proton channel family protein [SAR324 cluster bacterium]
FRQGRREEEFLAVYQTVVNMCEKRTNNELITDEEIEAVKNTDLRTWLQDFIVVDLVSEEMIEEIVRSEIEMYNYRSFEEIDLLEFMGKATPAFGMIGTVVGLILMLGSSSAEGADIAGVMGGMSVALITTLYGVLLSQLIFTPIASKRFQLKESQVLLLEMIREGLLYLKRRELPETAAKDLIIYLPPKLRKKILSEEQAALGQGLGL